jgi:predicted PurR-regulated permease PerM
MHGELDSTPFYKKLTFCLFAISLLGLILYLGRDIIIPFAFALLLAVLLLPAINFLEKKKVPRVTAILIVLVISVFLIALVLYFLSTQIISFAEDVPAIKRNLDEHYARIQKWIRTTFKLTYREQKELMSNAAEKVKDSTPQYLGETFLSVTQFFGLAFLLPIYTFLILYYRQMLRKFLIMVFKDDHEEKVVEIIRESKSIIQNYMVGLLIEMAIVAGMNITGFMILGINYAILLGVLAAILNLIPYIGMLIATILCMLVTISSSNNIMDAVWVGVILAGVQFIDNNILMPRIVGSKVKINALITILAVLIGGALCGFSGMFLAIPGVAILKIVFDRVDEMKPWGMLLGDDITGVHSGKFIRSLGHGIRKKPKNLEKKSA